MNANAKKQESEERAERSGMGFQPMDRPLISELQTNHDSSGTYVFLAMKLLKIFGVFPEAHGLEAHATFFRPQPLTVDC